MSSFLRRFLLRPSLWVAIITTISYWDNHCLYKSKWVYDDSGSVAKNVVVIGNAPWYEAFTRDFWGTSMKEVTSHKSFRPLTTLTFKANFVWNEWYLKDKEKETGVKFENGAGLETHSYKLINLLLHSLVSALVTEASAFIFVSSSLVATSGSAISDLNIVAQCMSGLLFGLHPVHAEAVSNVTSRGEMLMSLFMLLAFLSFAKNVSALAVHNEGAEKKPTTAATKIKSLIGIYVLPFLGMTCSLFSKEQGATTLISLVIYDFLQHHYSLISYAQDLFINKSPKAIAFLRRTIVLACQTVAMAAFRYWLNGETSPDFIFDQNPAGFSQDRFTRVFSTNWVYCLYLRDMIYPAYLCPDWSGQSILLIKDGSDERIYGVLLLWAVAGFLLYMLIMGGLPTTQTDDSSSSSSIAPLLKEGRSISIMAFWGFMVAPFLLSSNLLVVIGLMKADRVIYLPLFGFCILQALAFKLVFWRLLQLQQDAEANKSSSSGIRSRWAMTYMTFMVQMLLLTSKLHERNVAWSHSLNLWLSAYAINPVSHHTMYNCGYELSIKKRYAESEQVMRPIGNPRVDGPSNTFVYAMVLFNLRRCDEANVLIDDAMVVLDEKRAEGGPRNQGHMLDRSASNLLVARAHCVDDAAQRGRILYQAVQTDQTNTYAIQQAEAMMQQLTRMQKLQDQQQQFQS